MGNNGDLNGDKWVKVEMVSRVRVIVRMLAASSEKSNGSDITSMESYDGMFIALVIVRVVMAG